LLDALAQIAYPFEINGFSNHGEFLCDSRRQLNIIKRLVMKINYPLALNAPEVPMVIQAGVKAPGIAGPYQNRLFS